jgi:hypothetical protein
MERVFHDSQLDRLDKLLSCILKFEDINKSSLFYLNAVSAKLLAGVLYDMSSLLSEVEEVIDRNGTKVDGDKNAE